MNRDRQRYSNSSRGGGGPFLMASNDLRGNLQLLAACKMKLHQLLELVQLDHVGKDEIVPSLMNSARLLEKVFVDRSRGRNSGELDEDLFSQASVSGAPVRTNGVDLAKPSDGGPGTEVAASEVPDDRVQEWLTNTFTRRGSVVATAGRRRRLRSLAAVVRTSVYFERMFRGRAAEAAAAGPQPPPVPIAAPALAYLEAGAHLWEFDPFGLAELTVDRPVRNMGLFLFHKFDLIDKFSIQMETLEAFLDLVEAGYKRHGNPYHNCTHSADVAQSCCFIVAQHSLGDWLSDVELLALLFAALVHDFEHTGTTNNYHVQTRSRMALVYNDRSVLESHHVSAVFRRMHETGASGNLLKGLSQQEYRQFRSMVIDMVLATDMSTHFAQVSAMKDAIPCPENLPRVDILAYILHVADISHPAKKLVAARALDQPAQRGVLRAGRPRERAGPGLQPAVRSEKNSGRLVASWLHRVHSGAQLPGCQKSAAGPRAPGLGLCTRAERMGCHDNAARQPGALARAVRG